MEDVRRWILENQPATYAVLLCAILFVVMSATVARWDKDRSGRF